MFSKVFTTVVGLSMLLGSNAIRVSIPKGETMSFRAGRQLEEANLIDPNNLMICTDDIFSGVDNTYACFFEHMQYAGFAVKYSIKPDGSTADEYSVKLYVGEADRNDEWQKKVKDDKNVVKTHAKTSEPVQDQYIKDDLPYDSSKQCADGVDFTCIGTGSVLDITCEEASGFCSLDVEVSYFGDNQLLDDVVAAVGTAVGVIVGVVIGAIVGVCVLIGLCVYCCTRNRSNNNAANQNRNLQPQPQQFTTVAMVPGHPQQPQPQYVGQQPQVQY